MGRRFTRLDCWAKKSTEARASAPARSWRTKTGGIAFFPKTLDEVDAISRTVAHDIRNQYTIGYKPTNAEESRRIPHRSRWMPRSKGYGKLDGAHQERVLCGQDRAAVTKYDLHKRSRSRIRDRIDAADFASLVCRVRNATTISRLRVC